MAMETPTSLKEKGLQYKGLVSEVALKSSTHYIVDVAYSSVNVIHRSIFYTGFLDDEGIPSNYNGIFSQGSQENKFSDIYYMKIVSEITEINEDNEGGIYE